MKSGVFVLCALRDATGLSFNHTSYAGLASRAPKRQKCAYCGGKLVSEPSVWAAVEWRADGRYERPARTFTSPEAAQDACAGDLVVRRFPPS